MTDEIAHGARGLDWLESQVHREIDIFRHSYQPWVPPAADVDGKPVVDVLIVGGGLYGMGLAWGLIRSKVTNIMVVDQAPSGQEGIWMSSARMKTLRTAKQLTGIEFGIPSLSVRAYWEAKFGRASWEELDRIPRLEWFRYLEWFRDVLDLPVRNKTEVVSVDGDANLVRVTVRQDGNEETLLTRRLIMATGLLGSGGAHIPAGLIKDLPADRWAHSSDEIDFTRWRDAEVGVLGAGASAFDNAITAIENGAANASLFCRRPELPWLSAKRGLENAGFMRHFASLPDHYRWQFIKTIVETSIPPPRHTVKRALEHANFHLCLGSPWTASRMDVDKVVVITPNGEYRFDFVVFGTGFDMDIARRPEMAALAPHMLRWRDRFRPPEGEENEMLLDQPYLGDSLEFQERVPGACPVLGRVSMLGAAATLSAGPLFGGLNGLKFLLERMVEQTCRSLILETLDIFHDNFRKGLQVQKPPGALGSTD
jgi:cation diffusion facilitator CzcD-associated flavoprotein CzcO